MTVGAIFGGYSTFSWHALLLCLATSFVVLSVGYSVGFYRCLIHNSFQCPQWLENALVYVGVLGGTGGPYAAIEQHDLHDWAQRQSRCHSYFSHSQNPLIDWIWTLHCDIQLTYPPIIRYESRVAWNTLYHWLERTWPVQQLPLAILFYHFGGWSWVFWGIYVRIFACANARWLMQYLTRFECGYPHDHQTFSPSARISQRQYALDLWLIRALQSSGLAWNVKLAKPLSSIPIRHSPPESAVQSATPPQSHQGIAVEQSLP